MNLFTPFSFFGLSYRISVSADAPNALDSLKFLDKGSEMSIIINADGDSSTEKSVVGVDIDSAQQSVCLLGNDRCNGIDHSDIIIAHHPQGDVVLTCALIAPLCLDYAIAEPASEFRGIGTVPTVNLNTATDGDEAKDVISIDGPATLSKAILDTTEYLTLTFS